MNLLKEFSKGDTQQDLKTVDGTSAGAKDMASKPVDVKFSLMRNTINQDGDVSGSDVNDYLERAQDLNDPEVDSVGYAIETSDGEIIKVYVNAEQADDFEAEMANLLGLDDDSESAINTLAQKFDIVDVVWPEAPLGAEPGSEDPYADVSIDDDPSSFLDPDDEPNPEPDSTEPGVDNPHAPGLDSSMLPADDDEEDLGGDEPKSDSDPAPPHKKSLMKDVDADADKPVDDIEATDDAAQTDVTGDDTTDADSDTPPPAADDEEGADKPKKKSLMKDVAKDDTSDDDLGSEDKTDATDSDTSDGAVDVTADSADDESVTDEPELDADGNPKPKPKKKPKAEVTEEGLKLNKLQAMVEDARAEVQSHVKKAIADSTKGKFFIDCLVTGGITGRRQAPLKRNGKIQLFDTMEEASAEAKALTKKMNGPMATASFSYTAKPYTDNGIK